MDTDDRSQSPIRTEDLHKTYQGRQGPIHAVDGLDLEVRPGEFFGLLGPNGAGKSTTIGMLVTTVVPTSGHAFVAGIDVLAHPAAAKRRIGVVPQTNTLDRQLSVAENLYYHGRFFGVGRRDATRRTKELLELFVLADRADDPVQGLSGGMAQRLMVARALVHEPEILFLDEPTSGIDPQTRVNLWAILRDLHAKGQTILLTTHYMEEADTLCERLAIMDHGKMLALGTPAELKESLGADTIITLTVEGDAAALEPVASSVDGVDKVEREGDVVRAFSKRPSGVLPRLVEAASRAGLPVKEASSLQPSLETVFLSLTGREYRE
jgi:daunorubicin resistance ABC transporter ATP-binding subunit